MTSIEDRLKNLRVPDLHVESHRTQLGYRLMRPTTTRAPLYRRPVFATGMAMFILLAGLTAVHPSWAKDLLKLVMIGERQEVALDGKHMTVRTYQSAPGSNATSGTVQLQTDANGHVTSETTQAGTDPSLLPIHDYAETQIRSGQAQLISDVNGARSYRVTLQNGSRIVYTQGPGTSWSVSTSQ